MPLQPPWLLARVPFFTSPAPTDCQKCPDKLGSEAPSKRGRASSRHLRLEFRCSSQIHCLLVVTALAIALDFGRPKLHCCAVVDVRSRLSLPHSCSFEQWCESRLPDGARRATDTATQQHAIAATASRLRNPRDTLRCHRRDAKSAARSGKKRTAWHPKSNHHHVRPHTRKAVTSRRRQGEHGTSDTSVPNKAGPPRPAAQRLGHNGRAARYFVVDYPQENGAAACCRRARAWSHLCHCGRRPSSLRTHAIGRTGVAACR